MIIKNFELDKIKSQKNKLLLFYGNNQGHKEQIIENYFIKNFSGEIVKFEQNEILVNQDEFINNLLNKSLFDKEKLIIVHRATDKLLNLIIEIQERDIEQVKIILNCDNLEKRSKLRNLFEKDKSLTCIPFYEDNIQNLNTISQNFFREKNIKVSQEIINLLAERSKGDRKNLRNELNKIENLFLTKKKINIEDIINITNLAENYSVFELAENYLSKNNKKVSNILNENNYSNEDCILILRTILGRAKRLLRLKNDYENLGNIDLTISSFKPAIFWKEKEVVKKQIQSWSTDEVKNIIYKINDLEVLVKKNSVNSVNFISDFVSNY